MDKEDVVKYVCVGIAGYYIGRAVSDFKMFKRKALITKRVKSSRENMDFWRTIEKYLNDPNDKRTVEQMVDDWQISLKFHQIVNPDE